MNERFPIGFWNHLNVEDDYHVDPQRVARDWAEAGMTLAQSPYFDSEDPDHVRRIHALLDAAQEHEARVILRDGRTQWTVLTEEGEDAYRASLAKTAGLFADHPAVWGFMIGDEPGQDDFEDACRAYRIVQETAPSHSPFLNLLPWFVSVETRVGYERWSDYLDAYVEKAQADLLCYDCYVQMNPNPQEEAAGYEVYFTNLRESQEASQRHGVPWWTTLLSVGHFRYRPPQEDDLRWQMNTALAHGARGLLWYFFYMVLRHPHVNYRVSPIDEHHERTETYQWLSRVCRTALNWHLPLLQTMTLRQVHHVGRAWGGVPLLPQQGAGRIAEAHSQFGHPLIVSEFLDPDERPYLMVVNNSQEESELAHFRVRGHQPRLYQIQWRGEEVQMPASDAGTDTIAAQAWLAPGQAELYRVEEQDGLDRSADL